MFLFVCKAPARSMNAHEATPPARSQPPPASGARSASARASGARSSAARASGARLAARSAAARPSGARFAAARDQRPFFAPRSASGASTSGDLPSRDPISHSGWMSFFNASRGGRN